MTVNFTLLGKMKSGKNHVQITRTGQRYPKKEFVAWRTDMLNQIDWHKSPITGRVSLNVDYVPGDALRRDVPGILDALLHLLEKAGILEDDAQVKNVDWLEWPMDRQHPKCRVMIRTIGDV